ncbi:hypothetical protein B5S28_g4871 [[Candida] boidinii]|nr:hypothetical protein B5S28_g4871 [[Candida] boidinii]OWB80998.1 hypothetical protein B5S32_g5337 [[Candida] boidinii]
MDQLTEFYDQFIETYWKLAISLLTIAFNPIFWNIAARLEYKTHILTKLAFGKPKLGCYMLAATIFSLGIYRDEVFRQALLEQPISPILNNDTVKYAGAAVFGIGNLLVVSSMFMLGITGTYLGDYFGILMDERVTGFPFNVTNNPMYNGSTLCFLGTALWFAKPAGIFVAGFVYCLYQVALIFEEPFTGMIYAKRDEEEKRKLK